jgi:hypothetical protein
MPSWRYAALAITSSIGAAAACGGDGVTVVTVRARPAVHGAEELEITLANANATQTESFSIIGRSFPLTFSIETGGRDGELRIHGDALDRDDRPIGSGETTLDIDGRTDVEMMLEPNDFTVNTSFVGDQALAFRLEAGGRQIAVGADDVFTIGWSDSCEVVGRCDVFGRRFDGTATPVTASLAAGTNQFNFNRTNGLVGYEPSIATNEDGATIAAWSDGGTLFAVVVDAAGAATAFTETSIATTNAPSTPAVAALTGGRFIVAWAEDAPTAGQFLIKAVWLDDAGQPITNPVTGNANPYTVSTTIITTKSPPALVATGDQAEHALVWKNGSSLRGRFFAANGMARDADRLIGNFGADEHGEPQLASLAPEFALLFVRRTVGGDADMGQLILRRVTNTGARSGVDAILTREIDVRPMGLATRRADGAIAAVWEACQSDTDGSACGVRFQVFRPTLAAVGEPIFANTTLENTQIEPSVAALASGAFVAAWSDGSQVAPDTDGFGIRARVIYPPYDEAQGLGARCTSTAACGEGNVCMAGSDAMPRCYRACNADRSCTFGGSCTDMGDESACLF